MLLAVIVPYREQPACNRAAQLQQLQRRLAEILLRFDATMYVVEQSADRRRFNRGQLLNIGTVLAQRDGGAACLCFHDVDLLPDEGAAPQYRERTDGQAVHIGAGFARYAGSAGYLGGVLQMSAADVLRANGFPNEFWGWGGEDDAFRNRLRRLEIPIARPAVALRDMEELSIDAKLAQLKRDDAKCPNKRELVAADGVRWHMDGLNSLRAPKILKTSRRTAGGLAVVHTVVQLQ